MWLDDFRRRTAWNAYANRRQYDAPAGPWRLVHVDPTPVEHFATVSLKWGLGRVQRGDWDRTENCRSIDSIYIKEGLSQRFEQGEDWVDTTYYETVTEQITDTGNFRGCQSVKELESGYLPAVDDLYADMRENGYRPNRGVLYADPEDAEYIHDLEPFVLIGRDGEFIWTEGYHRLVLAQLLDISAFADLHT